MYTQHAINTDGAVNANSVYANSFVEINPSDFSGFTFSGLSGGSTGLIHANVGTVPTLYLTSNGQVSLTTYSNGFNTVNGYTQFYSNLYVTGNNVTIPNFTTIGLLPSFNAANAKFTYVDNVNNYTQLMLQNKNSGSTASGDIVVTADNGSDSTHYIDLGINSSTFNDGGIDGADDGYLLVEGGHLLVSTLTNNKDIIFATGGHNAGNVVARFKSKELNVTGNIIPAANVTYSLGNVNYQWKDLYVSNNTIYINNIPLSIAANSALLVNNNPVATTVNGTLTNNGDIYATGNVTANDTLRAQYGDIGNVQLYGGTVSLKPDAPWDNLTLASQVEGYALLELPRNVFANVNNVTLHNDAGNIQLTTGDLSTGASLYNWYFKNNGVLTLPSYANSYSVISGNSFALQGDNAGGFVYSYAFLQNNIDAPTQPTGLYNTVGNVEIGAGGVNYWLFKNDGIITTPNGGLIGNVDSNDPNSFGLKAGGSVNYVELNYGNDQRIYVDSASVNIGTNNNVSQYLWTFSDNGSTTFPDHKPVSITGNLTVGNLFVTGNSTVINTNSYTVSDNIIQLADQNPADILDLGFAAHRTVGGTLQHTGLVRDASANTWRLFSNITSQPGATIDFTNAVYDALQIGNVTSTGNVAAEYFLGYFQGLIGSITNLDSTNFTTQNIYAIDPDTGVNISAGGNNNLLVKPNEVKIQNVPLIANTVTANLGNVITTSGVFWSNGVAYSSGGSSYSNTNVVSMLGANTSVVIGNTNTYPLQANTTQMVVGNATILATGGSTNSTTTYLLNNIYYDASGATRYRNTGTGAVSIAMGGASGITITGTTSGVTGNAATGTGIWVTINGTTLSTVNGIAISSSGSLTTTSGSLISGSATGSLFNTTATTINFGGAATTITMGANTANVYVGSNVGNVYVGNLITTSGVFWSNGVSALTSSYGNTQVASYLTGNVTIGNIAMGVMRINGSDQTLTTLNGSAIIVGTRLNITGSAAGVGLNVTSGNISAGSATATLGNVITTNGVFWANGVSALGSSSYGNTQVAAYVLGNLTYGNISVTGIAASGNVSAAYVLGNGAGLTGVTTNSVGNIYGTSSNVTIVAGSYQSTFNNVGNVIVPTIWSTGNLTTTTGIYWSNGVAWSSSGGSYSNTEAAAYLTIYNGNLTAANLFVGGSGYTYLPNTIAQFTSNSNSYTQINTQNINSGSAATADYIATANNGSDTKYYIDLGITNSNYANGSPNNSLGTSVYPNDAYLYVQGNTGTTAGGNLVIGTTTAAKSIVFIAGGSNAANIVTTISNTGLVVTGAITTSSGGQHIGYITGALGANTPNSVVATTVTTSSGGQHIGYHTGAIGANTANTGAFTTISATGNVTATTANVYAANIIGNTAVIGAAFKYSNGAAYDGTYTNTNVAAYLPTYTGNVGAGNLIGTSSNVTITSGANVWTFDNTGNLSLPNLSATYILGANTNGNININTVGTGAVNVTGNLTISGVNAGYAPNRPAFRVYGSNSYQWQGGNTIVAGSVDYNQGSYYNAITGIFTAPIAGLYHAYATLRVGSNNGMNQASIQKNSNNTGANVISFWETDTNTGTATHFSMTGYAKLVAGDTVRLQAITGNINLDANDSWGVTYIG